MSSFRRMLVDQGIESCMLDDLVHTAACREASRVNNEGMKEQLDYLERVGYSEQEIMESLEIENPGK